MQERRLKIHYQWRKRRRSSHFVPNIRLSGEWLRDAGFEIDEQVTVKVEPGKLVVLAANGGTHE